jgi:hypothetical protein
MLLSSNLQLVLDLLLNCFNLILLVGFVLGVLLIPHLIVPCSSIQDYLGFCWVCVSDGTIVLVWANVAAIEEFLYQFRGQLLMTHWKLFWRSLYRNDPFMRFFQPISKISVAFLFG